MLGEVGKIPSRKVRLQFRNGLVSLAGAIPTEPVSSGSGRGWSIAAE